MYEEQTKKLLKEINSIKSSNNPNKIELLAIVYIEAFGLNMLPDEESISIDSTIESQIIVAFLNKSVDINILIPYILQGNLYSIKLLRTLYDMEFIMAIRLVLQLINEDKVEQCVIEAILSTNNDFKNHELITLAQQSAEMHYSEYSECDSFSLDEIYYGEYSECDSFSLDEIYYDYDSGSTESEAPHLYNVNGPADQAAYPPDEQPLHRAPLHTPSVMHHVVFDDVLPGAVVTVHCCCIM
jgi:hypothetical protein